MTQAQVPLLASQDISEAEGALTALLEQVLADTGTTNRTRKLVTDATTAALERVDQFIAPCCLTSIGVPL
jgi:hypothetical protein